MLQSRVADSLYWIARYLERAGHTIRLIDVRLDLELDRRPAPTAGTSTRLCAAVKCDVTDAGAAESRRSWSTRSCSIAANRGSVLACVTAARDNARQVREEISSDMWEQINALYLRLKQVRSEGDAGRRGRTTCRGWSSKACTSSRGSPTRRWDTAKAGSFSGPAASSSAQRRPPRWSICNSRATAGFPPTTWSGWDCCDRARRFEAYCRYYTADVRPDRVAEFLLLNAEFPRSVRFAAARVEDGAPGHRAVDRPRRRRPRGAARRPAARVARLRPGRRDPGRRPARLPPGHRPLLRADPRGGAAKLHLLSRSSSALPA